jgi:aspartyl-tRNA synthetase
MKRILIGETPNVIGEVVKLAGWVHIRRDHGKLIFIDLRDRSGMIQMVIIPDKEEAYKVAKDLRSEFVIEVEGLVKKRPGGASNEKLSTGNVELEVEKITVLNESKALPFEVSKDTTDVNEEARLKYRYLDLRTERMKNNIINRHKIVKFMRDYFDANGFLEIETPILTKGTPEGAREFVVPSRLHKGNFFVLPQSPQQFKQLLMVAGLERYFQVARCFRDEDQRGDRQPEFTQLDLEMSFVKKEDVMEVVENLLVEMVTKLYPEKRIQELPFPRIKYQDAMEQYGNDRPDIREDKNDPNLLAFCWVVDFPFFEKDENSSTGWTFTHNPFSCPIPEHMEDFMNKTNIENILTTQYDVVLNGFEIGGGSVRNHQPEALKKVFEIMGIPEEKIELKFGHMMEAFKFGAPPHGGLALGIDRIFAILFNELNIREVMAFPKTGEAQDLMMGAPSVVDDKQLKEAGIQVVPQEKDKK